MGGSSPRQPYRSPSLQLGMAQCEERPAIKALYQDYLHIAADEPDGSIGSGSGEIATPDSGIHELNISDPEQRSKLEEAWNIELEKTEEEIATLKQVLAAKNKHAQDLKRKLGITIWKELKGDVEQSLKTIQDTPALKEVGGKLNELNSAITTVPLYQKTSQTLRTATEKTSTVLGTLGASMSRKLGEVKNSSTYRSFEEKMGSAYYNVRWRVGAPRSTSLYSFQEAVSSSARTGSASAAATPLLPERPFE